MINKLRKFDYAAPFLVAIFTVVTLYQANAARLDPGQMVTPLVFSLLVAGLFTLIFWLAKWTARTAPFVAAIFTFFFLFWEPGFWWVSVSLLLVTLFLAVKQPKYMRAATISINGILVIAILTSGIIAGIIDLQNTSAGTSTGPLTYRDDRANIYFIVPDRMPSVAAMQETGIDSTNCIDDLTSMGFYIDPDKMSADAYTVEMAETTKLHTTRTMRFFASELNGGVDVPLDIEYQDCRSMIQNNGLFTALHEQGYTIVNVPSWFSETARFTNEDESYPFENVNLYERLFRNELGEAYFNRTLIGGLNFRVLESFGSQAEVERERLEWQAQVITDIAAAGPDAKFVIAHLTLPHEPYAYADPADTVPEQYYTNIRYALVYLDMLAREIRTKDPTATVIIQSDEGMAYRRPVELNQELSMTQWNGVFAAWYLPQNKIEKYTDGSWWYVVKDVPGTRELRNLAYIKHTDILDLVIGVQ